EEKQEQPQEVPATNGEKVEEEQSKEEPPVTPEETPVVENEEKTPEGATNAEVETDAGTTTTNQEVRLADWETEDKGSYVLITKYIGSSTEIVVPNEIDGKPTKLKDIDSTVFQNFQNTSSVTSFKVLPREDGTKVGVEATDLTRAFEIMPSLKTIDLTGLDTSNVTNMSYMFAVRTLEELNITGLDTSNVTNMSYMFYCVGEYVKVLSTIDVSSFNTSKVTDMHAMFESNSLKKIDLRHFDTSNVTNMSYMFAGFSGEQLDLSSFDTSNVTNMSHMFYYNINLTSLDISHFNTSRVTNMSQMFEYCHKLTYLDLRNFDTNRVTNMSKMFRDMMNNGQKPKTLDLRSFVINKNTEISGMFKQNSSYENRNALILATDSILLDYNYVSDLVDPVSMPLLNANGGQFIDLTESKQYFTKVAYTPEEFESINKVTAFEQFQKDNVPTKEGTTFRGWKLTEGNDSGAQNVYPDLYGAKYKAQWAENMGEPVTVKYVFEETGKEIVSSKTIEGEVGESYDATTPEYKLNIDGYVLDENRLPDNAKGTFSKEATEVVYYYKAMPVSLINGGFEQPVIDKPTATNGHHVQYFNNGQVPGWFGQNGRIQLQTDSTVIPAIEGKQWVEINTSGVGIYQDIATSPGDKLYWEFYHRGALGTSSAAVDIGASDGKLVEQMQITTGTDSWKKYSGFYIVPEGQTKTRFQLRNINGNLGNVFDNVIFTNEKASVTIKYVNEQGEEIKSSENKHGWEGELYDYTKEITNTVIPGYAIDAEKMPSNIKGEFTREDQVITVHYKTVNVNIPSQDVDNTKPEETSLFGIAYMPKQFQIGKTVLNDVGSQSILVNKSDRFDVGVRDLRNKENQWSLSAQLVWNEGKELPGSFIKTTNSTGAVMKNVNNGTDPFNPDTDLTDSNDGVQGGTNVEISKVPTSIMTANMGKYNAVYNYNLGDVSLEIPDADMVEPGSYSGNVVWSLENVPGNESPVEE
ncbi:BspA family leucine-rich repeat surface protein, partial [Enterococcus faecalis]|uniref:BspA family leucine-rich repeat surface protein n=1 Tax=Enterococcus faecalis TaxID=1351 RepID=UPI001A958F80